MTSTPRGPADDGRSDQGSPHPPPPVDADLAHELLDGLAEAVLTIDAAGLAVLVNATAAKLLPELAPGSDLARCAVPALAAAVANGTGHFETEHHCRRLRGVRRALTGDRSVWYVRDITDEQGRVEALRAERRRTAFLARTGRQLGLAAHRDQALRAAAALPVPYLADLALVVHLPAMPAEPRPRCSASSTTGAPGATTTTSRCWR
ncbi:hypothetical protein ACQPYA_25670 [Micromonospora sp. CA-263727]|uniref:hypothetical protein n=1 Tax=Micromonospora sp. CA-263727 TaxID=3239967 RepID=UPI003D8D0F50